MDDEPNPNDYGENEIDLGAPPEAPDLDSVEGGEGI